MAHIHPDLVTIAIERCGAEAFERYAQTVFGQVVGPKFKPLGGMHDGGADCFIEPDAIFEDIGRVTRFFQASKQITVATKLKHTVASLRKGGRDVQRLYFASSQVVQNSDRLAYEIGDELNVQAFARTG
jgi:hypothetical protein